MTDKPDPLDDLRKLEESIRVINGHHEVDYVRWLQQIQARVFAAIAAWEKERARFAELERALVRYRAELEKERAEHAREIDNWQAIVRSHSHALAAIRAAVEKVRDELRATPLPQNWASENVTVAEMRIRPWADALDAALRGEA